MTTSTNNIKTYRHEFSKEFMADLSTFAKVHQYDDRHTYKSEWTRWVQQNNKAIEMETRRLEENGYKGDIQDKMFKAGRYYFKKKNTVAAADLPLNVAPATPTATPTVTPTAATPTAATPTATPTAATPTAMSGLSSEAGAVGGRTPPGLSSEASAVGGRTPPGMRRPYITMSKNCIKMMDEHIRNASSADSTTEFKPSSCYSDFYKTKMSSDEMTKEIGHVIEKYEKTPGAMSNITPEELSDQIMDKIKKTYKNRYYKYTSSASNNNAPATATDK